jgi:type I restriction enzyme, S subunit
MMKYNKYKPSGVEWLGDTPEHWQINRSKNIFTEVIKLSQTGNETLLTVSHITGVTPRSEKNVNMFFAETMEGYKVCKIGDLIINTMWAWMGALGTSRYNGICSPAYNIYRGIKRVDFDHRFFDYLFKTPNFIVEMKRLSKGIVDSRLRLYPKDFFKIKIPLPFLQEQTTIANYLDVKTQAIDKKTNLLTQKINYYKELRKSIINKAVCKGLDKTVKLRESGINYINDLPSHWNIERIKDQFYIGRGRVIGQEALVENGKFPVYSSQTENNGCLGFISTYDFDKDLLTWTTDGANAGTVFRRSGKFNCTNVCGTLIPKKKNIDLNYVVFALQESTTHNKRIDTNGAKIMNNEMGVIHIAFPPFEEQTAIANYLDKQTQTIDKIIANITNQISTLKELRKTLINDVVTGKLKVTE